ncbi:ANTAR domain-containing protein [Kineococcus rhizosphaerae]|uniref:ANTAR domain-containing protein n=1 Tax=Kineococcus rhizosphaerae TaxID=559628 RepID=A0A2T0R3E5_9ACTN|nr:ANTAR domain-containing protein [Kineococcus rhizosphaerae]PRY14541.1 ANTAR domain-containing protein [Kineococcus rhizosphaerae]
MPEPADLIEEQDVDEPALGERLRRAFGERSVPGDGADDEGVLDRVADAIEALGALLDLGWVQPEPVADLLARADPDQHAPVGDGVRSLAEDLAVARLRARTAGERSRDAVERARVVVARSEQLAQEVQERFVTSRRACGEAGARVQALEEETRQLRTALENRPPIEHAVGIVMHAVGCDADTAWRSLSTLSQHLNVKVRVLAANLADGASHGTGLSPEVLAALRVLAAGGRLRRRG